MNILLIGMNFYNYETEIEKELSALGHEVVLYNDVPIFFNFINRLFPWNIVNNINILHQKILLKKLCNKKIDIVLVIVGRYLQPFFLQSIKEKVNKTILYLWDDVARVANFNVVKDYYDEIYSFDPIDCYDFGFKFLPLFYTNEFIRSVKVKEKTYDIYTAVSNHSDREKILKWFATNKKDEKLLFFLNFGKFDYFKTFFSKKRIKEIKNRPCPISKEKNIEYINKSKSLLDIQFSSQVGLTIRTIESIGMEEKLITTNASIKYYDFYDPNNIFILNRENPQFDWNFLNLPYKRISEDIYKKYSIKNWCKAIMDGNSFYYANIKKIHEQL